MSFGRNLAQAKREEEQINWSNAYRLLQKTNMEEKWLCKIYIEFYYTGTVNMLDI